MATTIVSSKGQVVIPRGLREKYRLLLTGDPEIEPLEGEQNLAVQWLARKP